MKTLYFDCTSGIAGDMCVAALLDLGANHQAMTDGLHSLGVEGYELRVHRVRRSGVDACGFDVRLTEAPSPAPPPAPFREFSSEPPIPPELPPEPSGEGMFRFLDIDDAAPEPQVELMTIGNNFFAVSDGPAPIQRDLGDIRELIASSSISPRAKDYATRIFEVAAKAEGKVCKLPAEEVPFHEPGAIGTIVEIVGAAVLIDSLGVDRILCSPLSEGQGTVESPGGPLPVPVPAALETIRDRDIPLRITENEGEMVTPTGAAIVGALAERFGSPAQGKVLGIGYGAGRRTFERATGILRVMLIEEHQAEQDTPDFIPAPATRTEEAGEDSSRVCEITCRLDIAGVALSSACEELMEAGALDVWTAHADGREGLCSILTLLCDPAAEEEFTALLLQRTTAESVRSVLKKQTAMTLQRYEVETPYGPVAVRKSSLEGFRKIKVDCAHAKAVARARRVPVNQVLSAAYTALGKQCEGSPNNV